MKVYMLIIRLLVVFFSVVSCSLYVDIVKVEVLNPSISKVPFIDKNVAIVGNLYEVEKGKYLYDSTLMAKVTQGIKQTLELSPVFDGYEIPIYYTYTSDTSLVAKSIRKTDIDSLANDIGADMLIVVDYIDIVCNVADGEQSVEFYMNYACLLRTYEVGVEKPYASYLFKSEIPEYIYTYEESGGILVVASGRDAKAGFAYELGANYSTLIAPYWEMVERVYYVGTGDLDGFMQTGDSYVLKGDWENAMNEWNKVITKSTSKVKVAMAAYNMAVGAEMLGDLELANEWLQFCKKQNVSSVNPQEYMAVVELRMQEEKILDSEFQIVEVE